MNARRIILHEISKELKHDELEALKFHCSEEFGAGVLENVKLPLELFKLIEDHDNRGDHGVTKICELLTAISRLGLAKKLTQAVPFQRSIVSEPVDHFVERQTCGTGRLLHALQNEKKNEITVIGPRAIGKSELVKSFCCKLEATLGCETIKVEASEGNNFTSLVRSIANQLRVEVAPGNSFQDKVVRALENRDSSRLILVLDVSKVPHRKKFCCELKSFVSQIFTNTSCNILITARYFCEICTPKHRKNEIIYLPYLSEIESRLMLTNLNVQFDAPTMESNLQLCQGCPLLLEHCAELSKDKTSTPRKRSKALCLHNFKLDESFKTQFEACTYRLQKSIVQLSKIRGRFSLMFAAKLLESDIDTACQICSSLRNQQLLIKAKGCYLMPQLVQDFVGQLIQNGSQETRSTSDRAESAVINLFLDALYIMNSAFMGFQNKEESGFYDDLLKEQDSLFDCNSDEQEASCCAPISRGNLLIFERYYQCFEWAISEGVKRKKSWTKAVDCANESVSFLAKALHFRDIFDVYTHMLNVTREKNDKIRHACTNVSLAFLSIYHYTCQYKPDEIIGMLEKAKGTLENEESETSHGSVRINDVLAHCCSKLGHLKMVANQKEAVKLLKKAIQLREEEIEKNRGSKAMIGACLIEQARAYMHLKDYDRAIVSAKNGLEIYRNTLKDHPFTATTYDFIAKLYRMRKDYVKADLFHLHAKLLSYRLRGEHLDTARFIREHAETYLSKEDFGNARRLLKDAHEMGKHFYNRKEHLDTMGKYKDLLSGDEYDAIRRQIEEAEKNREIEWGPRTSNQEATEKTTFTKQLSNFFKSKDRSSRGYLCVAFLVVGFLSCILGMFAMKLLTPASSLCVWN